MEATHVVVRWMLQSAAWIGIVFGLRKVLGLD